MKKKCILIGTLALFFLCSCSTQQTINSSVSSGKFIPTGKLIIPFKIQTIHHSIIPQIQIENDKGLYNVAFDTGSNYNNLLKNGVKKIFGDEKRPIELAYTYVRRLSPDKNEKELYRAVNELINSGGITCTLNNLTVSGTAINDIVLQYVPANTRKIDKGLADAIVGVNFFGKCNNILIDYNNKVIEIDAAQLKVQACPMRKLNQLGLYVAEVVIDGITQPALIDTGAEYLFIREGFNKKIIYSDSDIINYTLHGKVKKSLPGFKLVQVQVGNINSKYRGYNTSNMFISGTESGNAFGQKCSILGYEVFKGHRIQLDFEHNLFRIE
jgi:hypothetical protein